MRRMTRAMLGRTAFRASWIPRMSFSTVFNIDSKPSPAPSPPPKAPTKMAGGSDVVLSLDDLKRIVGDDAVYSRVMQENEAKKAGKKGRANHYGIASTMPPDNPSRRVDIIDIEDLTQKCEGGPCGLCRCYKSEKFPFCDGAHNKHNEQTGDNAGPVVVNTLPPEKKGLEFSTDISDEELLKLVNGPRANNYGVKSTMPPDNPSRSVHMVDIGDIRAAVADKGVVSLCRCFKSKKFPLCDGSHNAHNEQTGDNAGPIVIKATGAIAPPPPVSSHPIDDGPLKEISLSEVAKHNTKEDAWVVIHGKVYDVTSFLPNHPGGVPILAQYLGKVADEGFDGVHTDRVLTDNLPRDKLLGKLPASDLAGASKKKEVARPPIESVLSLHDMQAVAQHVMKKESWGYYITGDKDETTRNGNEEVFRRVRLAPRVMVDVSKVSCETKIMGYMSSSPLYVSGAAKGGFAHESAEIGIAKACYAKGVIQMAPHMASKPLDEIAAARQGNQVMFLQLYMEKDRAASEATVKMATELGYKALFVTVDSAGIGKRETDLRLTPGGSAPRGKATARRWADDMSWADVPKLRQWTSMPIILKGVQTGEDAVLAYKAGVEGIVVSNHGGRNCDTARPSLEVLAEVMAALKAARCDVGKFEVYLDGGVRRGSDIFKALAVGARAVGIGRPALFGLAAYGQAGVEKTLEILEDELLSCMQFMGTPTLADINPSHVKGLDKLDAWAWDTSRDRLSTIKMP